MLYDCDWLLPDSENRTSFFSRLFSLEIAPFHFKNDPNRVSRTVLWILKCELKRVTWSQCGKRHHCCIILHYPPWDRKIKQLNRAKVDFSNWKRTQQQLFCRLISCSSSFVMKHWFAFSCWVSLNYLKRAFPGWSFHSRPWGKVLPRVKIVTGL